jgi:hypothetical protein
MALHGRIFRSIISRSKPQSYTPVVGDEQAPSQSEKSSHYAEITQETVTGLPTFRV